MFGRESNCKFLRTYEYGCRTPTEGLEDAVEQMFRRNRLWNSFVEIENDIQRRARNLISDAGQQAQIDALLARRQELLAEIKNRRRQAQSRRVDISDLQPELVKVRELLAPLIETAKATRKQRTAVVKRELDLLNAERMERLRLAEKNSDLYWCNSQDVRHSYERARSSSFKSASPLRSREWDGSGRVTVRFHHGLPTADLFGNDTRMRIDPVSEDAWTAPCRATRRRLARTRVRLRVRSIRARPVWLTVPMVMHRPLLDGLVRSASLIRERVGDRWRYRLLVVVGSDEMPVRASAGTGRVAVQFGWRRVPTGLRVAYWADENGGHGELIIPDSDLSQFKKVDELRSKAAEGFGVARSALCAWMESHALPEALRPLVEGVSLWQSPRRLVRLFREWRGKRFDLDEEIYAALSEWYHKHMHLWRWEANLRDQMIRRRRELYRGFAARMAGTYGDVVIQKLGLKPLIATRARKENEPPARARYRFLAAPSVLQTIIQNVCSREGVQLKLVAGTSVTRRCHACDHVEDWDAAASIEHTCCGCGRSWDQDQNACLNLLKETAPSGDGRSAPT